MSRFHKLILLLALAAILGAWLVTLAKRQAAPAITLHTLSGSAVALPSLKGRVVLVYFWSPSCEPCTRQLADLADSYRQHHGEGLEILAVAMAYDQPNQVAAYAFSNGLPFPVMSDEGGQAAKAFYNVQSPPALFIIDRRGHLVHGAAENLLPEKRHVLIQQLLEEKA